MDNSKILENIDKTIALFEERAKINISPSFFEKVQLRLRQDEKPSFRQFDFGFLKLALISLFWIATLFSFLQIKNSISSIDKNDENFLRQLSEAYYLNSDSYSQFLNQ